MAFFDGMLTAAYTGTGFVDLIGFMPQIYALIIATGHSRGVSINAWGLWTGTSIIALLYAVLLVQDAFLIFVSSVETFGCATVLAITVYNRHIRFKEQDDEDRYVQLSFEGLGPKAKKVFFS